MIALDLIMDFMVSHSHGSASRFVCFLNFPKVPLHFFLVFLVVLYTNDGSLDLDQRSF